VVQPIDRDRPTFSYQVVELVLVVKQSDDSVALSKPCTFPSR
jgi:hypothetical protein